MIAVEELLQLSEFKNFRPVAGKAYLKHQVSNIVILEYESEQGNFNDFNEGDFVLTSLFFAKDRPFRILPSFERIMERGVSGIAVKSVYYSDVPDEVKKLAEEKQVPVFVFNDTYMEDIIISASDYIREQQRYDISEKKVSGLIKSHSPGSVLKTAMEINPDFLPNVSSLYMESIETKGDLQQSRAFNSLLYRRNRKGLEKSCFLIKYERGVLLLCQFAKIDGVNALRSVRQMLNMLQIDLSQYRIGVGSSIFSLEKLDACIQESLYAFKIAKLKNCGFLSYDEIGSYRFLLPVLENKSAFLSYRKMVDTIKGYDGECGSKLMETLECYADNKGDVAATAKSLFQHPNTIRYRLQKIRNLLGCDDDFELQPLLFVIDKLCALEKAK